MERLTARNENGKKEAYYPYCFREDTCDGDGSSEKCVTCEFSTKICEKLAEYEDTDMTPEEIQELKERDTGVNPIFSDGWDMCGSCGEHLMPSDSFCSECGQRIKWED